MKEIICADSLPWLSEHRLNLGSIITSLPDSDEIGFTQLGWRSWFVEAVRRCFQSVKQSGPVIFYQTDRKIDGRLESKSSLIFDVAKELGVRCLWHKVVLRHAIGIADLYRPGFAHMIAFSSEMNVGKPTPDVIDRRILAYPNAMNQDAARVAVNFAMRATNEIVDPFCGRGTIVAVADALGAEAIGIDIDPAQCEIARSQSFETPLL